MASKTANRVSKPAIVPFGEMLPKAPIHPGKHPPAKKIPPLPKQMDEQPTVVKKANHASTPLPSRSRWPWRRKHWLMTAAQRREAMETWEKLGADPGALAIIADRAPDVLEALLHSASIPGSPGFNDRAVVLRMIGLGHLLKGAGPGGAEADRRINALGDRLASKLMARAGHVSVTARQIVDAEPQENGVFEPVTHKTPDLVREPEPAVEVIEVDDAALDTIDWSG